MGENKAVTQLGRNPDLRAIYTAMTSEGSGVNWPVISLCGIMSGPADLPASKLLMGRANVA